MNSVFEGSEKGGFLPKPATTKYQAALLKYERSGAAIYSEMPGALGKVTNFSIT
jgi:hypothetical protein